MASHRVIVCAHSPPVHVHLSGHTLGFHSQILKVVPFKRLSKRFQFDSFFQIPVKNRHKCAFNYEIREMGFHMMYQQLSVLLHVSENFQWPLQYSNCQLNSTLILFHIDTELERSGCIFQTLSS